MMIIAIVVLETYGWKWLPRAVDRPRNRVVADLITLCVSLWMAKDYCSLFRCQSVVEVDYWLLDSHMHIKPMDNITNLIYCFSDLIISGKEQQKSEQLTQNVIARKLQPKLDDSLTLIVVIGESFIKWHSPLYGYELNTTPYLSEAYRKGNLFAFNDVSTPYNITSKVLRNVFSSNSVGFHERWSDSPFFPAVFRSHGYEVHFWDNQYQPYSKEGFDFSLNVFLHSQYNSEYVFSLQNKKQFEFDGELVEQYMAETAILPQPKWQMVIFHLMGQHAAYYNRFPHDGRFNHFHVDSIKRTEPYMTAEKRQLIADYDNAVYYNDKVIKNIIQAFVKRSAVLVFFSDHGEEVYDYQDSWVRNPPHTHSFSEGA